MLASGRAARTSARDGGNREGHVKDDDGGGARHGRHLRSGSVAPHQREAVLACGVWPLLLGDDGIAAREPTQAARGGSVRGLARACARTRRTGRRRARGGRRRAVSAAWCEMTALPELAHALRAHAHVGWLAEKRVGACAPPDDGDGAAAANAAMRCGLVLAAATAGWAGVAGMSLLAACSRRRPPPSSSSPSSSTHLEVSDKWVVAATAATPPLRRMRATKRGVPRPPPSSVAAVVAPPNQLGVSSGVSFEARAVAPFSRHRGRHASSSAAAVPAAPSQSARRLPGVDDDGGLSTSAAAAAMWLGAPFVWYVAPFDITFFFNFRSLRMWMSEFGAGRAARCDVGAQPTQT